MRLSEPKCDIAIGTILRNVNTGKLAVFCDYCDEHGYLVASTLTPIDSSEWEVESEMTDESWNDENGWIHEADSDRD